MLSGQQLSCCTQEDPTVTITHKRGVDILHDPVLNKGTATPMNERERLGLRGLLPPRVVPMEVQLQRIKDGARLRRSQCPPCSEPQLPHHNVWFLRQLPLPCSAAAKSDAKRYQHGGSLLPIPWLVSTT